MTSWKSRSKPGAEHLRASNHLSLQWEAQRLIAHELAHQWFGNSLTPGRWKDIWLNEGFACFSEWVYSRKLA